MPTILYMLGWRLFFYSNEGNEPMHVHAQKGKVECKFWLHKETFEITEAFSFKLSPKDNREIRKIIFQNFDYIIDQWERYFKKL